MPNAKPATQSARLTPVTLSEYRGVRNLHFGTEWIQGAMRIRAPFQLELAYTRDMMAWLLFLDGDRPGFQIGQLGLGAGSLSKFCWRYLAAQITVVERDPAVIACAYSMFELPQDSRLEVVEDDAARYLAHHAERCGFDVLQVDLYDAAARGPVCDSLSFYNDCLIALGRVGMLVVNLFGDHASFSRSMSRLHNVFSGRVIALPEIDAGNRIALAFKGPPIELTWSALQQRAAALDTLAPLRAQAWVRRLKAVATAQRQYAIDAIHWRI